jgi:transcriptional regulator with XRE-family HTH domain
VGKLVGNLGSNLRAARKERSWTQIELSERSGVHATEVSRIEAGKRDPQVSTVVKLSNALGLRAGDLLD